MSQSTSPDTKTPALGQTTMAGSVPMTLASDQPAMPANVTQTVLLANKFKNVAGNATTVVKSGAGIFYGLIIGNDSTGGTVTIYDNTTNSGTIIATLTLGAAAGIGVNQASPYFVGPLGIAFSTGLTVVTAGSTNNNITALYQ